MVRVSSGTQKLDSYLQLGVTGSSQWKQQSTRTDTVAAEDTQICSLQRTLASMCLLGCLIEEEEVLVLVQADSFLLMIRAEELSGVLAAQHLMAGSVRRRFSFAVSRSACVVNSCSILTFHRSYAEPISTKLSVTYLARESLYGSLYIPTEIESKASD